MKKMVIVLILAAIYRIAVYTRVSVVEYQKAVQGPLPQGVFLGRLGLLSRAAILARLDPRGATRHLAAAQRLAAPEHMGRLFKALCLCHPSLPTLPGFEES